MIDTSSLLLAHSVSLFTVSILICLVWLLRFPFKGPGWWTCAYLAAIAGVVLLSLRSVLPSFITIVCANFLTFAGLTLGWNGLRLFLEKPGFNFKQWSLIFLFLVLSGSLFHYFSAIDNITAVRFIVWACTFATIMISTIVDIWAKRKMYRAVRLLACIYLGHAAVMLARVVIITTSIDSYSWHSTWTHTQIMLDDIAFISTAFCFLMLISERLLQVVVRQYKELDENMRFRKQMENLLYHDLKSPMLPIVYLPDILLKNEQLSDSGKSKLTQIKEAAKRIMDLLNEALVAHKFETKGKADTHDVNILQLLRTVNTDLQSLQAEKNLHVILQADSELASPQASVIQGDESLLYRMFANLLKNAIQASPVNSPVSVRLDLDQKRLRITIKNRGEVPQNLRSSFFNKYARGERSQGLGLGTYSAKLAVQAHNGDISLNTQSPGNTEIFVWLPVTQDGDPSAGATPDQGSHPLS